MGSKYVNKPEVLIFSVYRSDVQDFHNQDCHQTIVNKLRQDSIPFKELDGRYQGVDEKSILVKADQLNLVQEICKQFRQDSYLHLSEDREATLVYHNGSKENIGKMVAVSEREAQGSEAYSYDPEYNNYFIVK